MISFTLLLFYLFVLIENSYELKYRIIHSSILHFLPQLKLHHILVVQEPYKNALYTLDFTPITPTGKKNETNFY